MSLPARPDGTAALPRVLLVEDEPSIRRFVGLALQGSGVELVEAATLAAAIEALRRAGPFVLLLCDLMLPDGSGVDLLASLAEPDAPSPGMRRVAFSAGYTAATRQRLQAVGVHEMLCKPVSVATLLACVQGALRDAAPAVAVPAGGRPAAGAADATGEARTEVPTQAAADPAAEAVANSFGGDQALFDTYYALCRQQWLQDVSAGDRDLARGDLPALRRLAHSLKSVLLTLGLPAEAALALGLDEAAAEGRCEGVLQLWPPLRASLLRLAADAA